MSTLRVLRSPETHAADAAEERATEALSTSNGASVQLRTKDGHESIEVRNRDGQLVFEYDPDSGRTVLSIPEGDLAIRAPRGGIDLESAEGLRVRSKAAVSVESGTAVSLGVDDGAQSGSRFLLAAPGARLRTPHLAVESDRATVRARSMQYHGEKLAARLESAVIVAERLETTAQRIFEKARNVYRRVEELHQLRAGRTRTHVEGAHLVRADTASVHAKGPVKIDGETIQLG